VNNSLYTHECHAIEYKWNITLVCWSVGLYHFELRVLSRITRSKVERDGTLHKQRELIQTDRSTCLRNIPCIIYIFHKIDDLCLLIPFGTYGLNKSSPSHTVARCLPKLIPWHPGFPYLLVGAPTPGLFRASHFPVALGVP